MESPGSGISTDSTDPSSADSTSADSTPAQAIPSVSENQTAATMDNTTIIDNDDSESDISMSADSEDEDGVQDVTLQKIQVPKSSETRVQEKPDTIGETSKKRKLSSSEPNANGLNQNDVVSQDRKRLKPDPALQRHRTAEGRLPADRSLLPAEIWHHIFTFCAPRVLGILLQVNRSFNAYIEPPSSGHSYYPLSISATQILTPDTIWRASRNLYNMPHLPKPLAGKSELDMWKLACGSKCQFCGKKKRPNSTPVDPWHPGPGENGVAPIWSFEIRACGPCLQKESMKEIDLLLSSSVPSPLLAALPFIFLTNELHVLSPSILQSGQQPPGIQVAKHFSTSQIDAIKREFEDVKGMGSATAEEWLKGLDGRGQEKKSGALRWERWEASGGITRMRNLEAIAAASRLLRSARTGSTTQSSLPTLPPNPSLPKPVHLPNNPQLPSNPQLPMPVHSIIASSGPPQFGSPIQNGFASYTSRQAQPPRHERTKEEVAEMKLARKEDIERRCMLLNPPITAAVLAHMPSFQAAIQIIQPLTESAWEVLEPRLLSQREEAEQRENDRLAQTRVVQERSDERRFQETQARSDSKDLVDREWDDIQAPLRARIGGYADEIIRDGWNGGEKVSYETSPRFAADVLIYVRKRFYAEIAKDDAAIRATGREPEADPPNGPYTRRLILENMKWVFDTKVKPYTEQYRKELFLCNACEYPSKYYGFEGVIQHYAAKHTNALSCGSVVVHWKSEWPEYPPFDPDPSSMTAKPYYPIIPNTSVQYSSAQPAMQQAYGYGGYQPAPNSAPMQAPNPQSYQESSSSYYGNPQYGDQYSAPQNGSYASPPVYQEASTGYQAPPYSIPPSQSSAPGYNDGLQGYSQHSCGGQYPSGTQGMYAPPHNAPLYPTTAPELPVQQTSYAPPAGEYGSSYNQPATYPPANYNQSPQRTEEYTAQLKDLAKNARNIWNSIGSLKEVPGSLKVHTIIYHILQRFRTTFQNDPPLSMLVDGLANNKDIRPVRNVNGLLCKACSLGMAGSPPASQKKHFSFPQLVNHFHSVHEQGIPPNTLGHIPDWTKDMVDLPEISKLTSVVNAPGMDDQKLKLFTDALPEIVSVPEAQTEDSQNGFNGNYEDRPGQSPYPDLPPSQDNHDQYYAAAENGRPEVGSALLDSGEYDPRNPGNISFDQPPVYKAPRRARQSGDGNLVRDEEPSQRYRRYEDEPRREVYQSPSRRPYVERRPSSSYGIPVAEYERVIVRDEAPIYLDRHPRYHDSGEVEYRVRRDPQVLRYDEQEMAPPAREYRVANNQSFQSNRDEVPPMDAQEDHPRELQAAPAEDAAAQHSRIIDVVAQISQHAQQAREKQPVREDAAEAGSEDGEVRGENGTRATTSRPTPTDEAGAAAERFLNNLRPGESTEATPKTIQEPERRRDDELRPAWEADRNGSIRVYQAPMDTQRRVWEYEEDERFVPNTRRIVNPAAEDEYIMHERAPIPRVPRAYAYDDRYVSSVPEPIVRDRSPELVDRRYKLNNVVYRDERQGSSNGTHRTPSRYARYESVRLENDRARSRSPVYVKMGPQPGQYRERSPGAPPLRQEPIYRTRTPLPAGEDIAYERLPPRQEYYRVYADEPRPRAPQYAEPAYEYVRVADPQGDYMIRRPVRREPEPVYYEDGVYARQPVYESRAPMPRAERAEPQYEEYDPRQPAPAPAPVRQARYQ